MVVYATDKQKTEIRDVDIQMPLDDDRIADARVDIIDTG